MKKLLTLLLFLFVPLFFVGCFKEDPSTPQLRMKAFEDFADTTSYTCNLSYKDGEDNIVETCFYEEIFDNQYYYYSYSKNNEIEKQYWINSKEIVSYVYKEINNEVSSQVSTNLFEVFDEASENFDLLRKSTFLYTKEELQLGTITETGGYGDFILTIGEYQIVVNNDDLEEIKHKDYTIKYEKCDPSKIPYINLSKKNSPDADKETFDAAMGKIEKLEALAQDFITENNLTVSKRYLALNYIRSGKASYCSTTWNTLLGEINQNFIDYVADNEGEDNVSSLKSIQTLNEPYTSRKIDFMHLIAVLSFGEKYGINNGATDLGGIGGDIAQLTVDIHLVEGDKETLLSAARQKMAAKDSGFNTQDYDANIAAINIIADIKNNKNLSLSEAIKNYYYCNHDMTFSSKRALTLLNLPLESIEETVYLLSSRLTKNTYIQIWLTKNGAPLTVYYTHFDVCVEAFLTFVSLCL